MGPLHFRRRMQSCLFLCQVKKKKIKQKYKVLFHEHMLQSSHFMQAFKIAQLEKMVWGRIPQEKEK